jgi:hypothetical protein
LELLDRRFLFNETVVLAGGCRIETRWFEDDHDSGAIGGHGVGREHDDTDDAIDSRNDENRL